MRLRPVLLLRLSITEGFNDMISISLRGLMPYGLFLLVLVATDVNSFGIPMHDGAPRPSPDTGSTVYSATFTLKARLVPSTCNSLVVDGDTVTSGGGDYDIQFGDVTSAGRGDETKRVTLVMDCTNSPFPPTIMDMIWETGSQVREEGGDYHIIPLVNGSPQDLSGNTARLSYNIRWGRGIGVFLNQVGSNLADVADGTPVNLQGMVTYGLKPVNLADQGNSVWKFPVDISQVITPSQGFPQEGNYLADVTVRVEYW